MILSLLLITSMAASAVHNNGFDQDRLLAISERMRQFVRDGEVAGTVTLIQRKGKTVFLDSTGFANLDDKRSMAQDTIFQVMSMTKPITAIAVMICAERGLLNLDDPVERYMPNLSQLQVKQPDGTLKPKRNRLTIRHLLNHTGGFSSIDPAGLTDEAKVKLSLKEYADKLHLEPLISEPGTEISYSGPGFAAAGRIIEVVSGKSLEDFMRTEIFGPLGMKDTFFFAHKDHSSRIAHLYFNENGRLNKLQDDPLRPGARYANPAGGLYSTASDMAALMGCLVNGGKVGRFRLLSPASISTMTIPQTPALLPEGSETQGYGLGFAVVRNAGGTAHLKPVGSFGHVGAFGTEFWGDPKTGIAVVFMSQSFSDRVRKTFNTMVNAAYVGP